MSSVHLRQIWLLVFAKIFSYPCAFVHIMVSMWKALSTFLNIQLLFCVQDHTDASSMKPPWSLVPLCHAGTDRISSEFPLGSLDLSWAYYSCLGLMLFVYSVTQSRPILCDTMDYSPPGSSDHGDSPGKNAGVGCHAFFQEIFPTQGSRLGLPHCRQILYHLRHQENPKAVCIHPHFLLLEQPPGALRLNESHLFLLREQVSRNALLDEWWRKESKKVRKAVCLCC